MQIEIDHTLAWVAVGITLYLVTLVLLSIAAWASGPLAHERRKNRPAPT